MITGIIGGSSKLLTQDHSLSEIKPILILRTFNFCKVIDIYQSNTYPDAIYYALNKPCLCWLTAVADSGFRFQADSLENNEILQGKVCVIT